MSWEIGILIFNITVLVANILLLSRNLIRRRIRLAVINTVCVIISTLGVGLSILTIIPKGYCNNAPAMVPYKPGMTLCPGQSAVGTFTITIEPDGKDI